eukprot:TRINITY_DN19733_c0_g1_i1.p1 TRINITY_DN19733_c0_g1~~TRINITY_DN19733_c0_g1_i1.p1  ORF type:complete len:897 (+),score=272.90 TRINITY_DN19733_c0_g1_i1:66-2756(+)
MHADPAASPPLNPQGGVTRGQLCQALDAVLAGRAGADRWVMEREVHIIPELCEVFLAREEGAVPRRQLAGVTLARLFAKHAAPAGVKDMLLAFVTEQQDEQVLLMCACDMLAQILKQEAVPPEGLVAHCVQSDPGNEVANRLLFSLAAGLKDCPLQRVLLSQFVLPFLGTASAVQMNTPRLGLVRHIVKQWPGKQVRQDLAQLVPRVYATLSAAPLEYIACFDALQLALYCSPLDANVGAQTYQFALAVLRQYGPRIASGEACQEATRLTGTYTEALTVHAALQASHYFLTTAAPDVLLTQGLEFLVQAAVVHPDMESEDDRDYEELDCITTVDVPSGVRSAAVWMVSCLLRTPDDDGPTTPIPNALNLVVQHLTATAQTNSPHMVECALFFMQKLAECRAIEAHHVPVEALFNFANGAGVPSRIAARACLALAGIADRSLTPNQLADLANHQWAKLCDVRGTEEEVRIMAGAALGRMVCQMVLNEAAKEFVRIGPELGPLLALVPAAPALLLEALDSLLQVLGDTLLTPMQVEAVMTCLLDVLQKHSKNTKLCERVLRVIRQSVINEHKEGEVVCSSVVRCSSFILDTVLRQQAVPAMQALCHAALEVAGALADCTCSCGAVAPGLSQAIATLTGLETKLAVREACKALASTTSAAARRGVLEGLDLSQHMTFLKHYMSCSLDYDRVSQSNVALCALSLATYLPLSALSEMAVFAVKRLGEFWAATSDWKWPTSLALLWAALLIRSQDVPQALAVLGEPAQQVEFLSAWLSLDAIHEPAIRPVSATAAHLLLTKLSQEYLRHPVALMPISSPLTRRMRNAAPVGMQLGDALLIALLRIVEKPLTPFDRCFPMRAKWSLPHDDQIQTHAARIVQGLGAAKREGIEQFMRDLAARKK